MPLPTPKSKEEKEGFISRCMKKITEEEKKKWPDEKQRAAICYSQWDSYQKKHGHPEKAEK